MPLSKSPYKIIHPNDRWVPSSSISEKDKRQLLPPLVKKIRQEVFEWRKKKYPGLSKTSRNLFNWWFRKERENFRYYFWGSDADTRLINL